MLQDSRGTNWTDQTPEPIPAQRNDEPWSSEITHRMRVLLHADPILDLRRGDRMVDPQLRHYDSLTLALKTFDLVVSHMGLDHEVDFERLQHALTPLLVLMDRAADVEPNMHRHRRMVARVVGRLRNDDDARRPFHLAYRDFDEKGEPLDRVLEFRLLLDHHHPDGSIVLRLTNEAINLYLNALELEVEDAQAAAEAVVQSQLARGKFDEAVRSAQNARLQSLRYREQIHRVLRETRRDLRRVDWVRDVPDLIDGSIEHIRGRLQAERNILESAQDKLDHLEAGTDKARHVSDVVDLIHECMNRHLDLHRWIMPARQIFLEEQARQSFAPRPRQSVPDLGRQVLEPVLRLFQREATKAVSEMLPAVFPPSPPRLPSLDTLLHWLLQPRRTYERGQVPIEERDLVRYGVDPLRYPEEVRRRAARYLETVENHVALSELLRRARAENEEQPVLEYLALQVLHAYAPDEEEQQIAFDVRRAGGDRFETAGLYGDDLILAPAEDTDG